MKVGIIYCSKTGNSKNLALIAKEKIISSSVEIKSIEEIDLQGQLTYDLLVLATYCDSDNFPKKFYRYFDRFRQVKNLACILTHATYESGEYYTNWAGSCEGIFDRFCSEHNVNNYGYFHCRAKPSKAIALFIRMQVIKDKQDWNEYKHDMYSYPREIQMNSFDEFIGRLNQKINLENSVIR